MKTYRIFSLIIAMALVLSACNMPSAKPTEQAANPNAVFTAAAETVVAQLTQSALLNPTSQPAIVAPTTNAPAAATNTPQPAPPPAISAPVVVAPTAACDAAQFITDVSIPDGTPFTAGATFTKTWRLKNIGTCTWSSSYALVYDSGTAMGGAPSIPIPGAVSPGGSIDLSVNLQAPSADGSYTGFWGLTNASGARIPVTGGFSGRSFSVVIKVGSGTSGSTPDSGEGKFAVTSVSFNVTPSTAACASIVFTVTATVTTNKAGDVTYTWYNDGTGGPSSSGTLSFDSAGSKAVTVTWTPGASGKTVKLYIDKPNHQYFGPVTLTCP